MTKLLALFALFGHLAAASVVINRLHSRAMPYWCLKAIDAVWCMWLLLGPVIAGLWLWHAQLPSRLAAQLQPFGWLHLALCAVATLYVVPGWLRRSLQAANTSLQLSNDTQVVDMTAELGARPSGTKLTRLLSWFPGNEIFQLHVNQKHLVVPRLRPELDGLTITHLSDLHYTGQVTIDFHQEAIRRANALRSDLVVVTGDLIDKRKCMSWLRLVVGQLQAPHGVYFVLGNHDLRVRNESELRGELTNQGLIDLGRRWVQIEVRRCPIVLAGNELPWFTPAANLSDCPRSGETDSPFRILLSHAPDQLPWARAHNFDLMLAGHCHGGQIRLPGVGPILCPSRFGVQYASGTFFESPTLLHVSRGLSGTRQLRLNAPPELTQLVLTTPRAGRTARERPAAT